jgi:hypothetical protein
MDRRRGELVIEGMFAEDWADPGSWPKGSVAAAIGSLAAFAGGALVIYRGATALGVS